MTYAHCVNLDDVLDRKLRELAEAQRLSVQDMHLRIIKAALVPEDLGMEILDTMLKPEDDDVKGSNNV